MPRPYSLAYLTTIGMPPVETVTLASKLGFDSVGFRLLPAGPGDFPPPLLTDDRLLAEVLAAMVDTGITMSDAEMIRLNEDTRLDHFLAFLERIRRMGARHILVAGDDPDRGRLTDTYGRLCELAWDFGLTVDLEFMPWTPVASFSDAREIVEAASHPAAAILLDTLHFDRSRSKLEDLETTPAHMMNYVQICDGPAKYDRSNDAMIALARTARLIPRDGDIDLAAIAARLPPSVPVSIEVPNTALRDQIGIEALVARALGATRALLGDDLA